MTPWGFMMGRLPRISFDLLLILMATASAILLRTDLELPSPDFVRYIPYLIISAVIAVLAIGATSLDLGVWRYASLADILRVIAVAAATSISTPTIIFAYNRLEGIARTIPILQLVLITVFILAPRLIARCSARTKKRIAPFTIPPQIEAPQTTTVLLVGLNVLAEFYLRSLAEIGDKSVRVAGLVSARPEQAGRFVGQHRVLGSLQDIERAIGDLTVHGIMVDRIILAIAPSNLPPVARLALSRLENEQRITIDYLAHRIAGTGLAAAEIDKVARVAPKALEQTDRAHDVPEDFVCETGTHEIFRSVGSLFKRQALEALARSPYWRLKRGVDVFGACVLMIALLPVGLLVAVLVTIDVGWPFVFWQERLGVGGVPFKLYKLRTMAAAFDRHGNRLSDNERLSVIGIILRRSRLDELPQLWNVFVGDMSLIGPRPLLPIDQAGLESGRLLVRPGLTGWAQVQGGRDIGPLDKTALDIWFIRNASFYLDARIVFATIVMVLFGERINRNAIAEAWQELSGAESRPAASTFRSLASAATNS